MLTPKEFKQISAAVHAMHNHAPGSLPSQAVVSRNDVLMLLECWREKDMFMPTTELDVGILTYGAGKSEKDPSS